MVDEPDRVPELERDATRRMAVIESAGVVSVMCSDKTGTWPLETLVFARFSPA